MQYLGTISKMTEWSLFVSKAPFNIKITQVYAPTTNAKEAEVEQFYEDLQNLLELTPKKMIFHHWGLECKSRKSRETWKNRKFSLRVQNEARQRITEFCLHTGHLKHPLTTT